MEANDCEPGSEADVAFPTVPHKAKKGGLPPLGAGKRAPKRAAKASGQGDACEKPTAPKPKPKPAAVAVAARCSTDSNLNLIQPPPPRYPNRRKDRPWTFASPGTSDPPPPCTILFILFFAAVGLYMSLFFWASVMTAIWDIRYNGNLPFFIEYGYKDCDDDWEREKKAAWLTTFLGWPTFGAFFGVAFASTRRLWDFVLSLGVLQFIVCCVVHQEAPTTLLWYLTYVFGVLIAAGFAHVAKAGMQRGCCCYKANRVANSNASEC